MVLGACSSGTHTCNIRLGLQAAGSGALYRCDYAPRHSYVETECGTVCMSCFLFALLGCPSAHKIDRGVTTWPSDTPAEAFSGTYSQTSENAALQSQILLFRQPATNTIDRRNSIRRVALVEAPRGSIRHVEADFSTISRGRQSRISNRASTFTQPNHSTLQQRHQLREEPWQLRRAFCPSYFLPRRICRWLLEGWHASAL